MDIIYISDAGVQSNQCDLQQSQSSKAMTTQVLQSTMPIYLVLLCLLCNRLRGIQACPLPSNASCSECDLLRHIQLDHHAQNINLNVQLNLVMSQNSANSFAMLINSENNGDFTFYNTRLEDPVTRCIADAEEGSPCTNHVVMEGERQPLCTWNYTCDYSPHRFPQYIWKAKCDTAPPGYRPQPIYYNIPTLTVTSSSQGGCLPFQDPEAIYRWGMERVEVACSCTPTSN